MQDEQRRCDVRRVAQRRDLQPGLRVLELKRADHALEGPSPIARSVHRVPRVDRVLGARGLEPIRVGDHPRGHVATVRAPDDTEPVRIAEPVAVEGRVQYGFEILVVDGTHAGATLARPPYRPRPCLGVAGRTAWVRVNDDVAGARVYLKLVEEPVAVLRKRTTVNVQQDGVLLPFLETGRAHDPCFHLGSVWRSGDEALGGD